jgi:hypothetical protein
VLQRAPDAAGLQFWTNALQQGASEASVLVGFSDSLENRILTAGATHANWVSGLAEDNVPWVSGSTRQPTPVEPGTRPAKNRGRTTGGGSRLRREVATYFSRIEPLLSESPNASQDQEVLELTLSIALGGRDTRPIARALLARYGTLEGVIASPPSELSTFHGLGKKGVAALKLMKGGGAA